MKKILGLCGFTDKFYQTLKKELSILHKIYQKKKEKETLLNSLYEANIRREKTPWTLQDKKTALQ